MNMHYKSSFFFLFALIIGTKDIHAQQVQHFTLKECIQYGLQHHPSVQLYQNTVEKAHQTARESLAGYLPQVSINAGLDDNLKLQQTIIPAGTFGPGTPEQRVAFGTQYNSSLMAQLDQKIYDQSLITGLKANQPNKDLAVLQEAQNNELLIYNIASAYYQILVAQKQLSLLESNKARFEKILKVTQLQAEQGVIKKVDVKQVQVNLNNVLAQISTTKNTLELAENTLKNNMGISQADHIVVTDTARWLREAPALKMNPGFDYSRSLDYQLQQVQLKLYDINRRSIRAQALPTLSLYGRYGANGFGQDFSGAFDPILDYSAIGLKLSWNIFSGFRRDAQYKLAVLDMENAQISLTLNEAQQSLQFQNADAQAKRARSNIQTNKNNMELAAEVYDNVTIQHRQGLASISDLLNAELSYREAQNNYINALLDYYLADLALQQANGTLENYYKQL